ncbi:Crp/Fnr family transcriptional regulator [Brachyspira suanatina]|uniref:Crp/Fnr family transcriptional regulator n=1 Tax=Brachyspira suanatina TaxID=381802 RepID=A0A0G4K5T2_9SPIR|nr:cyclic nucleotide-binding domain-containing protein [Brachyspira suanatina]CRF32711.1 Crp/Fnr family transcriptional regulator [Brachyspira suanatina]
MEQQYNKVTIKKSTIIFQYKEPAKDYFYIILKGKVIAYNVFYQNYDINYREGDIIGLISSIINEPYYSTIESLEDIEVLKISVQDLTKIDNYNLINKISNYLSSIFETWLSKYYSLITNNKVNLYNKEDIVTMANIYKNRGFTDASYKICNGCIKLFKDDIHINEAKKLIINTRPIEKPTRIEENVYSVKKGYCLYTEIEPSSYTYIIRSGKVGIYSIIDSKAVVRSIYSSNYIINYYKPVLDYKPLFTTAIVLEDSVIEIIEKDLMNNIINRNNKFINSYIKSTAAKINNIILKIKALSAKELNEKLIILIYSFIKMDTLFEKNKNVRLYYSINDIKNILNIDTPNNEIFQLLEQMKYMRIDKSENITINNYENFFREYENYIM